MTNGVANPYLHLLLGLTPVEPVQLGIVVSRTPPPVFCKASHRPTQLHHTHLLHSIALRMLVTPSWSPFLTLLQLGSSLTTAEYVLSMRAARFQGRF